jgi:hypothetical protein
MLPIVTAIIGIFIALLLKRFLLVPDRGRALWVGYLEFPVDANLAAFMFGIGSLSGITASDKTPPVLLTMVALMVLSVLLWKYSCTTMSDRDSEVYFAKPKLLAFLTFLNISVGIAAIATPLYFLGAGQ